MIKTPTKEHRRQSSGQEWRREQETDSGSLCGGVGTQGSAQGGLWSPQMLQAPVDYALDGSRPPRGPGFEAENAKEKVGASGNTDV